MINTKEQEERIAEKIKYLEEALEKAKSLTTKKRKGLPKGSFAFPKQRKMPLSDASRVRNAAARFNQVEGVSEAEKRTAYRKILAAGKKFGVDLTGFKKKYGPRYG